MKAKMEKMHAETDAQRSVCKWCDKGCIVRGRLILWRLCFYRSKICVIRFTVKRTRFNIDHKDMVLLKISTESLKNYKTDGTTPQKWEKLALRRPKPIQKSRKWLRKEPKGSLRQPMGAKRQRKIKPKSMTKWESKKAWPKGAETTTKTHHVQVSPD